MQVISRFVEGNAGVRIVYQSGNFQIETGYKNEKGKMNWGGMSQRLSLEQAKERYHIVVLKIKEKNAAQQSNESNIKFNRFQKIKEILNEINIHKE